MNDANTRPDRSEAFLIVGEIRKAHAIKGECFVVPATDDVAGVYAQGRTLRLGDADGRPVDPEAELTVAAARAFKGGLIVRFEGVHDRNVAEAFRGRTLLMRAKEVRPLEVGEYFIHDLEGLEVFSVEGERLGRVTEVYEGGTGHLLSVDDGAREQLIPFIAAIVREVDLQAGRIVIAALPGLLSQ